MVLNSQNEKFAGFRLLAQIEARIDAVDRLKNKIYDLIINYVHGFFLVVCTIMVSVIRWF